jgi:hypothetical protein
MMTTTTPRKKLRNVTWTSNAKPCKTLKAATGCWTDTPPRRKDGKVGGPGIA